MNIPDNHSQDNECSEAEVEHSNTDKPTENVTQDPDQHQGQLPLEPKLPSDNKEPNSSNPGKETSAANAFNELKLQVAQHLEQLQHIAKVISRQKEKAIDSLCNVHENLHTHLSYGRLNKSARRALEHIRDHLEGELDLYDIKIRIPQPGDTIETDWMKVIDSRQPKKRHVPGTVAQVNKPAYITAHPGSETESVRSKSEIVAYKQELTV